MKSISFRFDVDTPLCFNKGVPNLINIGERNDCKFTFFVNVGRAIDHLSLFRQKKTSGVEAVKLGALEKFGVLEVLNIVFRNPFVADNKDVAYRLSKSEHEIGLHGGKNHSLWHRDASIWHEDQLIDEINWGIRRFSDVFGRIPESFSSPGWNSPPKLPDIIKSLGFSYFADLHGFSVSDNAEGSLLNIATQLVGEPGGVGYFEWLYAQGFNEKQAMAVFRKDIYAAFEVRDHVVLYDHPGFCAVKAKAMLEKSVAFVKSEGIVIKTMSESYRA